MVEEYLFQLYIYNFFFSTVSGKKYFLIFNFKIEVDPRDFFTMRIGLESVVLNSFAIENIL